MFSIHKIKNTIGYILTIGTIVSALFVLMGGLFYLLQHGQDKIQMVLMQPSLNDMKLISIWHAALHFSPMGLIGLGVFTLVGTQLLRVALLAFFYLMSCDYVFGAISLFILLVLLYSIVWHR
jgi:uncharacterized membrane protein